MAKRKGQPKSKAEPARRTTAKRVQAEDARPFKGVPTVPVKPEVDEDAWGDDGLTIRQRLFVMALVGPAGGCAAKAAELAGYRSENRNSLRVTACQTLTKPNVQRALARAYAEKFKGPEWVEAALMDYANSSMANFLTLNDDGELELDMEKAAHAGAVGQIKEFKEEGIKHGGEVEWVKRTVKVRDPLPAIQTILKMRGLLHDRHEHSGPNGGPIRVEHSMSAEQVKAILADRESAQLANALARRMAGHPVGDGQPSN